MSERRWLIVADGDFGPMTSKTANCLIRFRPERCVAVLERRHAGKAVQEVLGFGGRIPVIGSVQEGAALGANTLVVGIAPMGGRLPDEWRAWLVQALELGMDLWSGLHTFLGDDPLIAETASRLGRTITDFRRPPPQLPVASGLARDVEPLVVLTVGTDCNVGKMTAQCALIDRLRERGLRARFVATGQTGMMLEGWGVAVDAVVSDFVAGAAEWLTLEGAKDADVVLVEGQGSINHPGYSGVTLGLLHGSCPDALLLCHQASRTHIGDYRRASWLAIPPLAAYIDAYERIGSMVHPTRTIGISLNTYDQDEATARAACAAAARDTSLPATDPVRFDPAPLVDAIVAAHAAKRAARAGRR